MGVGGLMLSPVRIRSLLPSEYNELLLVLDKIFWRNFRSGIEGQNIQEKKSYTTQQ